MPSRSAHYAVLVSAAIATGWIGWLGHPLAFGIAVLFPALWAHARDRFTAASVALGYFLAASRGLPAGVANFYQSEMWIGFVLWIIAASCFVIVHAFLWTNQGGWRRPAQYLAVMIVMALPPAGIVGWAHPLTVAGVLFPGWGWVGLAATVALLTAMTTRFAYHFGVLAAALWLAQVPRFTHAPMPDGFVGIDTAVGGNSAAVRFLSVEAHQHLLSVIASSSAEVVVLPENAAGAWTPTVEHLWRTNVGERTVLVGATVIRPEGYENAVVLVDQEGASVRYRQRMPVPVAMWHPWTAWWDKPKGASAAFFEAPVVELGKRRLAVLICYEQLLVWPVLHSMASGAHGLIAVGNGWWTEGTSIVPIQQATMQVWARLFGVPLVVSFNI